MTTDVGHWHIASFRCYAAARRLSGHSGLWRGVSPANLSVHGTGCIGRLDGHWERNLQPWDKAAEQIIVREAGGTISGTEGSDDPLKTGHVVCGNEFVHGNW
jgi:hypothetical protein